MIYRPQDIQLEATLALRKFRDGHDGSETVRQRIEAMTEDQKILLIAELLVLADHASKMGYIV